jgi:hypothetical protein
MMGRNLPAYIPTRNFVQAILDLALRPKVPPQYAAQQTASEFSIETLRASVSRIESPTVQRALRSAIDSAQGDVDRVRKGLEEWYDSAMDRVSGWYKHQTQWILIGIGLVMAVVADVDTVRIAESLYSSPAQRAAAIGMAQRLTTDTATTGGAGAASAAVAREAVARLDSLQLPILWHGAAKMGIGPYVGRSILGWLVTALAVSLGAPFWFDLLNKVMVIRSTVKPHEKSPEEASEDRQQPNAQAVDPDTLATTVGAAVGAALSKDRPPPTGTATQQPVKPSTPPPPHTPREWANGMEEDGII